MSTTHLHEFKSPDRINTQTPVMSLYLHEQKLGSHSTPESSSHKFMLKGRQTGGMHRGHGWVFRAESHDTMLAWYEDVRNLTEKTGLEREAFVRKHARSMSNSSARAPSLSSDGGMDEDEADRVPYSANPSHIDAVTAAEEQQPRPQTLQVPRAPGGHFQSSDLSIERGLHQRFPSSGASSIDRDAITPSTPPGSGLPLREPGQPRHDGEHGANEPIMHGTQEYQRSAQTQAFIRAANSDNPPSGAPAEEPVYTIDTEANPTTPGPLTASRVPLAADADPTGPSSLPADERVSAHDQVDLQSASALGSGNPQPSLNTGTDSQTVEPQQASGPVTPVTVATTATGMSDSTVQTDDAPLLRLSRPLPVSQNSVATISDLHVPGEWAGSLRERS